MAEIKESTSPDQRYGLAIGYFKYWNDAAAMMNITMTPGERLYLWLRRGLMNKVDIYTQLKELGIPTKAVMNKMIKGTVKAPSVILNDGVTYGELLFLARHRSGFSVNDMVRKTKLNRDRIKHTEQRNDRRQPRRSLQRDRDVWTLMKWWQKEGWPIESVPLIAFCAEF